MYAIFYKEWIKTRWYFLLAVVTTLGFTGYCMLRINRVIEMKGAAHVWEVMMQRDAIFIDMLQYIPLIAGVLMAIVQFVPEMQRKCLKLTLHLPYPELKMTGNMLFSGLVLLLVCFASNFLLMEVYLSGVLAHELKNHILLTALTWYLAGISPSDTYLAKAPAQRPSKPLPFRRCVSRGYSNSRYHPSRCHNRNLWVFSYFPP